MFHSFTIRLAAGIACWMFLGAMGFGEAEIAPHELALQPAPVIAPPGPEHADDQRLFQGIPGLERAANGRGSYFQDL
jgi:hypothetical protein